MSIAPSPRGPLALSAVAFLAILAVSGPVDLRAADEPLGPVRLGSRRGTDGKDVALDATPGGLAVLLFYSPECPISNAYSPTLAALVSDFSSQHVTWAGICVDPEMSDRDLADHARDFGLKFPVIRDPRGSLARKLGATITPEAFVIDPAGKVRYHGRIDGQFAKRGVRNANATGNELRDALVALLKGEPVAQPFVAAVGCPIPRPRDAAPAPTYSKEVARILQANCQECHRKGQVGPFALETYDQARKRAADIAAVTEDRSMPPWKAAPGIGPKFRHDRSLSDRDIAVLLAWSEAGAPEGDPADLPAPRTFPADWAIEGGPDLVLDIGTDFQVPASGGDIYRCFVVPVNLPADQYVTGIEYQPGNRSVVHHVLSYVDVAGQARKRDEAEPGRGYTCFSGPGIEIVGDLGGWAPGNQPTQLEDGIGRALPAKCDVVIQVHYHPSGKVETDRTRIGLRFARKPIRQVLHWNAALNTDMKVPAGASNAEVQAAWPVPVDVMAHAVVPHMHLLGKDMRMSVTFPDGKTRDLIRIDRWDFNWQYSYYFEQPLELPKGSVVKVVAHYDNSGANPSNPNKVPREVTWGEATTDEMCIGFIAVTKKGQDLTRPGEKDDLNDVFRSQVEDYRKKRAESPKRRGAG
ncbi:redoxin domain-containing protein [Aquisphaera insulae]|uniref:redoxin domain-containing protein n=1 Tax=Aquisphaera insulae TaxID=2712864 RepID=UPI002030967D|nr:redoxin domain-containing protein [Aquisphaera insulae]